MLKIFASKGKMITRYYKDVPVACTFLHFFKNELLRSQRTSDFLSTSRLKSIRKPQLKEFNRNHRVREVKDSFLGEDRLNLLYSLKPSEVDVRGISKGKGFTGVMKRHGFKGQCASHGHSLSHRRIGSLGAIKGRIWPGRKMAGRDGSKKTLVRSLDIIEISKGFALIKGSIPGNKGGTLELIFNVTRECN